MDAHLASPVPAPFMARDGIGTIAIRVVSVAAVLAILVASSGAVWLNRERLFGGNGDGGPQVPYGSFMMPNGQEVEVAYDVPSAEDCTVEPLNVDGVLRKLEAWPAEWEFGAPGPWAEGHTGDTEGVTATSPPEPTADDGEGQSPATSTAPIQVSGTPDATRPYDKMISPYILPEATFDEVAAVQRQWLACALFGSPFQRWALETNRLVTQEFQARYFPVFDMAQIRGDLEALARGDDNPFTNPVLTDGSLLPMVPAYTNGYYNVMRASWDVSLTVVWVRPDGTPILNANEEFVKSPNLERWLPNVWRFLKSPETGQWYLGSTSVGMG